MTKLNNKQLKKLYDYGGTLTPKDWADTMDSLDNSLVDTDSLPIIKTTYSEVVDLYHKGMLNPNVKYEFDYEYPNHSEGLNVFFKDLRIYIDGKDIKVEYKPNQDNDDSIYSKQFVAKFKFDTIITNNNIYECKGDRLMNIELYSGDDRTLLLNTLDEYSINYEIVNEYPNDDGSGSIGLYIYNAFTYYYEGYYSIYSQNKQIIINEYSGEISINSDTYTILAAITDVQYRNTFHNVFIDRHRDNQYLEALEDLHLYDAPLDTTMLDWYINEFTISDRFPMISFGSIYIIETIVSLYMEGFDFMDTLVIYKGGTLYKMNTMA